MHTLNLPPPSHPTSPPRTRHCGLEVTRLNAEKSQHFYVLMKTAKSWKTSRQEVSWFVVFKISEIRQYSHLRKLTSVISDRNPKNALLII